MAKINILKKLEKIIPKKWKKRIPNIITTARIVMAILFIICFLNNEMLLSVILFAVASISDAIDGFLARRWNVKSKYGKYADPFADKLLVGSTLLLYSLKYNSIMFLPLAGELLISLTNTVSMIKNGKVDVNKFGKIKTITLMSTIALTLLSTLFNNKTFNKIIEIVVLLNIPLQIATFVKYFEQLNFLNSKNQLQN